MSDVSELVERLHRHIWMAVMPDGGHLRMDAPHEAADALTAQQAEIERLREALDGGKMWSRIRSELNNCSIYIDSAAQATKHELMSSALDEIARRVTRAALTGKEGE